MTAIAIDQGRRQFLITCTTTLGLVGVGATAVPFLASWQPTASAKLASAPVRIDVSKLSAGEGVKLLWRGQPMWVIRRGPATVAQLDQLHSQLKDPDSLESEQPSYAQNGLRARNAEFLVLTAVCTHLQCVPELKGKGDLELGGGLESGFFCPCHGSRFDAAGRVLKGSPAATNLPIPAHHFADSNTLVIGEDEAAAT